MIVSHIRTVVNHSETFFIFVLILATKYDLIYLEIGRSGLKLSTFGDKLKYIREISGITQDDMAKKLGTTKQVISRYETNQRTPKITVAVEYAKKLNAPLDYLIDDSIDQSEYYYFKGSSKQKNPASDQLLELEQYLKDRKSGRIKHAAFVAFGGDGVKLEKISDDEAQIMQDVLKSIRKARGDKNE